MKQLNKNLISADNFQIRFGDTNINIKTSYWQFIDDKKVE